MPRKDQSYIVSYDEGVTFAPQSLLDARKVFTDRYPGIPITSFGITGDRDHVIQGTGYHLGRDQLKMSRDPYSAKTKRDLAGLSDAASAFDIPAEIGILPELSQWMVGQCRAKASDTLDIREIVFSPDGNAVLTWDRERGVNSFPAPRGNLSHRLHTHCSWYRDSEFRDRAAVFRRFFDEREDMSFNEPIGNDYAPAPEYGVHLPKTGIAWTWKGVDDANRTLETVTKDIAVIKQELADLVVPVVTDEQLERVLRKVLRSLPEA